MAGIIAMQMNIDARIAAARNITFFITHLRICNVNKFYAKERFFLREKSHVKRTVPVTCYLALYRNVTICPLVQFASTPNFPFSSPDVNPVVIFFWKPQSTAL